MKNKDLIFTCQKDLNPTLIFYFLTLRFQSPKYHKQISKSTY